MQAADKAQHDVCEEIIDIMRVYDEQSKSSYGVDTPGGLEHMGDVWRLFDRWRAALAGGESDVSV